MCSSFVISSLFLSPPPSPLSFFLIAGSVEEDTHGETTDETCNGDGPVESFVVSRRFFMDSLFFFSFSFSKLLVREDHDE